MDQSYPLLYSCEPRSCTAVKIMRCERVILGIYRKHLAPFDLTSSQFSMMMVLARMGAMRQVELCAVLSLEKSSVSRNLNRMLSAGHVQKKAGLAIEITAKGKSLLERSIPSWEKAKKEVLGLLGTVGGTALDTIVNKLQTH